MTDTAMDEPVMLVREVVSRLRTVAERMRAGEDYFSQTQAFSPSFCAGTKNGLNSARVMLQELIDDLEEHGR